MRTCLGISLFLVLAAGSAGQSVAEVDPQHYRIIFENSHLRVIEGRDKPGDKTPMHHHPVHLSYVDGPVMVQMVLENGQTIVDGPSDKVWCGPPTTHSTENIGTTNTHEVMVEFKDFDPCDEKGPQLQPSAQSNQENASTAEQSESAVIATVVQNEKAAFEAIKNKDKKTYAELMADEITNRCRLLPQRPSFTFVT